MGSFGTCVIFFFFFEVLVIICLDICKALSLFTWNGSVESDAGFWSVQRARVMNILLLITRSAHPDLFSRVRHFVVGPFHVLLFNVHHLLHLKLTTMTEK